MNKYRSNVRRDGLTPGQERAIQSMLTARSIAAAVRVSKRFPVARDQPVRETSTSQSPQPRKGNFPRPARTSSSPTLNQRRNFLGSCPDLLTPHPPIPPASPIHNPPRPKKRNTSAHKPAPKTQSLAKPLFSRRGDDRYKLLKKDTYIKKCIVKTQWRQQR